jgi:hypothetical protein
VVVGVITVVVVVVVVAGGGVDDWARNVALRAQAMQKSARLFRATWVLRYMMSLVVRYLEGRVAPFMPRLSLQLTFGTI